MKHSWLMLLAIVLALPATGLLPTVSGNEDVLQRRPLDLPSGGIAADQEEEDAPESIHFWGSEFEGDQFVIVFPAYGFCGDTTVYAAIRAEVTAAIQQLSPEATFDLVCFNAATFTWRPIVVPASNGNCSAAVAWMNTMSPIEQHCIVEACTTALGISQAGDGQSKQMVVCGARGPYCTTSGSSDASAALMAITGANYQQTPMHTVYFTTNFYSGEEAFYQQLAAMNGGTFRLVAF